MIANQFTAQGVREHNEDAIYPEPGQPPGNLFIVADGLGGHADGKIASELACRALREIVEREDPASFVLGGHRLSEPELMQAFLSDAVRQVGVTVWHEARRRDSDMGCTLTAVLLKNGRGYCVHVGDCALFVSEAGQMPPLKLTTEHRRGSGLTRTLGAQESVTPDVFSFAFGDESVLVMGCDGFWEHVSPERIGQLLLERPPYCVAQELAQAALDAGSQDNVSVIVVEGDAFAGRNASGQIEAYAAVLARRDNSAESNSLRRALLKFCLEYPEPDPAITRVVEELQERLSGPAQVSPPPTPPPVQPVVASPLVSQTRAPSAAPEPARRERELLEQIAQLTQDKAELQRQVEAARSTERHLQEEVDHLRTQLRRWQAQFEQMQQYVNHYRDNVVALGQILFQVWARYPKQCEDIVPRKTLQEWKEWWQRQQGIVEPSSPEQPAPEDKKRFGLFKR